MRLLLDEMYPPAAAERLRQRGVDAVAVTESVELKGRGDAEVLAAALSEGRVLVTENVVDFVLLGRTADHVGIVFCHPRRFLRDANRIGRLVDALAALALAVPPGLGEASFQWWLQPVAEKP